MEDKGLMARPGSHRQKPFPLTYLEKFTKPDDDREETLVMIKPDAFERGIVGSIISRFEAAEMRIEDMQAFNPGPNKLLHDHYAEHHDKPFFGCLISFMCDRLLVIRLSGHDVINRASQVAGDTEGTVPGTIRGDHGVSGPRTLVHTSDSLKSAQREIEIWF